MNAHPISLRVPIAISNRLGRSQLSILSVIASGLFLWAAQVHAQVVDSELWSTNGPVRAIACDGNTIYIGGDFTSVGPSTGSGVPLSGPLGGLLQPFPKVAGGDVRTVLSDGSGGWFIGGDFIYVGGLPRHHLAHILADGSVAAWDPNANASVWFLAVSGSLVYAGGDFSSVGGQARNGIAALDATSGVATTWTPPSSPTRHVHVFVVSGDVIYASVPGLVTLDATTGNQIPANWPAFEAVYAMAVSGDIVYASGRINGIPVVAEMYSYGSFKSFFANGSEVRALVVSGDTIYVGGTFTNIGGYPRDHIAALDANTGLAIGWSPSVNGEVDALVLSGGRAYIGGAFTNAGGAPRNRLAALDLTTGDVTAWDPGANGPVLALAVNGDSAYAGGHFTGFGGWQTRNHIAALDATTGAATAWDPNADGPVGTLTVSGDKIYAGGSFTTIGGQTRNRIAALDAATGTAAAWDPNADGSVGLITVSGDVVYAAGSFGGIGGQTRHDIAALDAATGAATAWDANANGSVGAISVSGDKVYIGGSFTAIGGQVRNGIAALDTVSGAATDWDPAVADCWQGDPYCCNEICCIPEGDACYGTCCIEYCTDTYCPGVSGLAVTGATAYVGGSFLHMGGQPRNNLAALDATTGSATDWDPNANSYVRAMVLAGSALFAVGDFIGIGGQFRPGIASVDTMTGVATIWNASFLGSTSALALSGNTVYVGGDFVAAGGEPQLYVARFPSSATVDVPTGRQTSSLALGPIVPSPVSSRARIRFTLPARDVVTLKVYDIAGRQVASLLDGKAMSAGPHDVELDAHGWWSGCYFLRLTTHGESRAEKLIVLR